MKRKRHLAKHPAVRHMRDTLAPQAFENKLFFSLILILIIVLAVFVITQVGDTPRDAPEDVIAALSAPEVGFLSGNEVDSVALAQFDQRYDLLKESGAIQGDFYVYFEDDAGNIVPVDDKTCFGSPEAMELDPNCQ